MLCDVAAATTGPRLARTPYLRSAFAHFFIHFLVQLLGRLFQRLIANLRLLQVLHAFLELFLVLLRREIVQLLLEAVEQPKPARLDSRHCVPPRCVRGCMASTRADVRTREGAHPASCIAWQRIEMRECPRGRLCQRYRPPCTVVVADSSSHDCRGGARPVRGTHERANRARQPARPERTACREHGDEHTSGERRRSRGAANWTHATTPNVTVTSVAPVQWGVGFDKHNAQPK